MVFFTSNRLNTMLLIPTSVPVTTYLGGRRVVIVGVVFDFLRNYDTIINFGDCFQNRRNCVTLIHTSYNYGMLLGRPLYHKFCFFRLSF